MAVDSAKLAALVGSRICHDLISPVGAINNGLELLGMSGAVEGPELELISDSVLHANARIRFFRVAFGAAGDQQMGRAEILSILEDVSKAGRMSYSWAPLEGSSRSDVRMVFLALLCLETALPYGARLPCCVPAVNGPSPAKVGKSRLMTHCGAAFRRPTVRQRSPPPRSNSPCCLSRPKKRAGPYSLSRGSKKSPFSSNRFQPAAKQRPANWWGVCACSASNRYFPTEHKDGAVLP